MKVRIKKTGQILDVEYDDDDLYKGWDGSGPVWFTFNEFDIIDESISSLTASINIVDAKTDIKVNAQPLFTLTPEEVEIAREALLYTKGAYDGKVALGLGGFRNLEDYKQSSADMDNLLNRIKEWQDENRTHT